MRYTEQIDLRNCNSGDILVSCHGLKLRYIGKNNPNSPYPHRVKYPNGSEGCRLDDGTTYKNKPLPTDHNIIQIIKKEDYELSPEIYDDLRRIGLTHDQCSDVYEYLKSKF